MYKFIILAAIASLLCDTSAKADDDRVTSDEVLGMMARIPSPEGGTRVGGYERGPDAKEIANAIAAHVNRNVDNVFATRRQTAATMAVYSSYESGNTKCAVGDSGRSLGFLQLQRVSVATACSPFDALVIWASRAKDALETCANNPPEERLAPLASGNCAHARLKTRGRMMVAKSIISETSMQQE